MGVIINPESELGKELAKWEQHRTKYVPDDQEPGHPYVYRPYPWMLYRCTTEDNGQVVCLKGMPHPYGFTDAQQYERACFAVEQFNLSHQRIVQNEREHEHARREGWRNTPTEALQYYEALQQEMAQAAAEAAHAAQRMSSKAQAELKAADESTHEHVVDVKPARKRGRPAKAKPIAVSQSEGE